MSEADATTVLVHVEYEGVPYNSHNHRADTINDRLLRTHRALYEAWRNWAENNGHLTMQWGHAARHGAGLARLAALQGTGSEAPWSWEAYPNDSWKKYERLQGMLRTLAYELLFGPVE